jgi:Tol biopolymer transport system component
MKWAVTALGLSSTMPRVTSAQAPAQNSAQRVPVLRPKVVELGPAPADLGGAAALSPNGRLVAYGVGRDGGLSIWNAVTREVIPLVTGPVHVHHWMPTGDGLYFQTHAGAFSYQGAELSREPSIWTIRVDSLSGKPLEAPHLVASVSVNHGLSLSPDHRLLSFAQYLGSYVSALTVVPVTGGTPRILASGVEVHGGGKWSADGSTIEFSAHENASSKTRTRYRVPVTGGIPVPIREEHPVPIDIADNAWSVANPATGGLAAYSAFPEDVDVGDWSGIGGWPGRRELAAVRTTRPRGVQVVNLADRSVRTLIDTTAEVVDGPEWFAQNRLAVIVRESGKLVLLTQQADGRGARRFPLLHHLEASQLHISPDGQQAAFHSRAGGFGMIQVLNLMSGRERTLVTSADDFGDGSGPEGMGLGPITWSGDSKRVIYIAGIWTETPTVRERSLLGVEKSLRPLPTFIYGNAFRSFPSSTDPEFVEYAGTRVGPGTVTLVPIGAGAPRIVFAGQALGGPLSPDGHLLAIQIGTPNGPSGIQVRLVSPDGSNLRTLPLPFIARTGIRWHPDGQHLLMLGSEEAGAPPYVYSVAIDGGAPVAIAPVGSTRNPATLAVSPDGRFIAVTVSGTPKATFVKLVYDVSSIF